MSAELASIATQLMKIGAKAARDDEPLIEELAREVYRLSAVVQRLDREIIEVRAMFSPSESFRGQVATTLMPSE